MPHLIRILVVDKDLLHRRLIHTYLNDIEHYSFFVKEQESLPQAIETLHTEYFDVIIANISWKTVKSMEIIENFKDNFPDIATVVYSHIDKKEFIENCLSQGAGSYLVKSKINCSTLVKAIHHAITTQKARKQVTKVFEKAKLDLQSSKKNP